MKTLIVFWHGIGDCVILTPALKQYQKEHPKEEISLAVKKIVIQSRFFEHCPYVNKCFEIPNPWNIGKDYKEGQEILKKEINKINQKEQFDKIIYVPQKHIHGVHKLDRTVKEMGLKKLKNRQTEIYLSKKDRQEAKAWLEKKKIKKFVFLHRDTNFPSKDMPKELADKILGEKFPKLQVVEVGKDYSTKNKSINFSFAILEQAKHVIVVDSIFMHAAGALRKDIDIAYFNFRPGVEDEVKPPVKMRVVKGPRAKKNAWLWFVKKQVIRILAHFW